MSYYVVKLLKNRLYSTYQFHAYMANEKTNPKDGLRLAALTTMQWLKLRLGEEVPEEWTSLLAPEDYMKATDDDLPPLYINQGHVVNVVSLPEDDMWTMQITEPDLGNKPGSPDQTRPPVPGRVIETNIAFRIVNKKVECGFKIVISDPVGDIPEAEVYRIAVVRQLIENPAFGLKQVIDIPMEAIRLKSKKQINDMLKVTHDDENALPAVIFTQPVQEQKKRPTAEEMKQMILDGRVPPTLAGNKVQYGGGPIISEPPYDLKEFTHYTFSYCRTYVLENAANGSFLTQSDINSFVPGEIIILYPTVTGSGYRIFPYESSSKRRKETIEKVEEEIKNYMKSHKVDFGNIMFLSGAREQMFRLTEERLEEKENDNAGLKQDIAQLKAFHKDELIQKEQELEDLRLQLQQQKEISARLDNDKTKLRLKHAAELEKKQDEINGLRKDRELILEYFVHKRNQPKKYEDIPEWVKKNYSEHIVLHQKAIDRLLNSSRKPKTELICDAIDFLATEHWDYLYNQKPAEVVALRCDKKYGRPFDVAPTGQSVESWPLEYKIKYFRNEKGKLKESPLNHHLRVGHDLRIYFLYDDKNKKIVIGSLPDHLSTDKFGKT